MATSETNKGRAQGAAGALALMLAIATPIYTGWEGTKQMPYRDIVGVWTVCSGDTRNVTPGVRQTDAQCEARTRQILIEYGEEVRRATPIVEKYPYLWAAFTIFHANTGSYPQGTPARLVKAGKLRQACRFLRNYRYAGGKVVKGLINRREGTDDMIGEYELCLVDAIPHDLGRK